MKNFLQQYAMRGFFDGTATSGDGGGGVTKDYVDNADQQNYDYIDELYGYLEKQIPYVNKTEVGVSPVVKAVDEFGSPEEWEYVELARKDEFDILNRNVGSMDTSLGQQVPFVETAKVGQTVRVADVSSTGKPSAWEPVDLPSGGGGSEWKLINSITTTEDALRTVVCSTDTDGNPFSLTEVYAKAVLPASTTVSGSNFFYLNDQYFNGPSAGSKVGYGSLYANGILNQVSVSNEDYGQWYLHGNRGIPNAPYITKVALTGQSGGAHIPAGTTLEVWGR